MTDVRSFGGSIRAPAACRRQNSFGRRRTVQGSTDLHAYSPEVPRATMSGLFLQVLYIDRVRCSSLLALHRVRDVLRQGPPLVKLL